jgi:hypothetical protein
MREDEFLIAVGGFATHSNQKFNLMIPTDE